MVHDLRDLWDHIAVANNAFEFEVNGVSADWLKDDGRIGIEREIQSI